MIRMINQNWRQKGNSIYHSVSKKYESDKIHISLEFHFFWNLCFYNNNNNISDKSLPANRVCGIYELMDEKTREEVFGKNYSNNNKN